MKYRTLMEDLRTRPVLSSEGAFVAKVMGACREQSNVGKLSTSRKAVPSAVLLVAAAAAIIIGLGRPHLVERFAARGSSPSRVDGVLVQALLARGHTLLPLEGADLRPGDGIAVRYAKVTPETRFLMIFMIDAAGIVHWIHPAYLDESSNPRSIELVPSDDAHLLGEIVEPDHPALGPLRVISVASAQPITVKSVEQGISRGGGFDHLFAHAHVREWRCSWTSR